MYGAHLSYAQKKSTGFKFANRVVFDVSWSDISTWYLQIKIPEEIAENFQGNKWEYQRYDAPFNNALFRTKSGKFEDIQELGNFLILAYKRISGLD